jgi:tRNA acetyltransferase TAN1
MAVRTSLDPRAVIHGLRAMHERTPEVFRCTFKWVPVDLWSAADLDALRQAVTRLRDRIAPDERWRLTIERRTDVGPPLPTIIEALAALVDRKVDLGHPDKILRVELFAGRAALAVVTPDETFSPARTEKARKGIRDVGSGGS